MGNAVLEGRPFRLDPEQRKKVVKLKPKKAAANSGPVSATKATRSPLASITSTTNVGV